MKQERRRRKARADTEAKRLARRPRELPAHWQEWLAENLMRGVRPDALKAVTDRNALDGRLVDETMERIGVSPIFAAGYKIGQRKQKFTTLLEALSKLYRQSGYAESFQKIDRLPAAKFYRDFYHRNRPVVVRGLMSDWPALKRWTPTFFGRRFGEVEIEITDGRNADARFEDNFEAHRSRIKMKDYVNRITRGGPTNDCYLVAKNFLLEREEFKELYKDFRCPKGYLEPATVQGRARIWFGPQGTLTPLHHDACNILFAQIRGRKRVQLISPYDLERVYNDRNCYSSVDLENIDYEKFPLMKDVSIIDVVLHPGEFILLPIGWWHWVRSLDISLSISFTNFCVSENIVWGYRS